MYSTFPYLLSLLFFLFHFSQHNLDLGLFPQFLKEATLSLFCSQFLTKVSTVNDVDCTNVGKLSFWAHRKDIREYRLKSQEHVMRTLHVRLLLATMLGKLHLLPTSLAICLSDKCNHYYRWKLYIHKAMQTFVTKEYMLLFMGTNKQLSK